MIYENDERDIDFVLKRIKELKYQKYELSFYEAMDCPSILRMDVTDCDMTIIMSGMKDNDKAQIKESLGEYGYRWFD